VVTIGTPSDATPVVGNSACAQATTPETLCGGVMFYNSKLPTSAGGPFILNSNAATMKLASFDVAAGDPNHIYQDIVIFQDRTVTESVTLNGSTSFTVVEGIVYVPAAQIKLNGNGGTLIVDQVIANTYDIKGNGGTIKVLRGKGVDAIIVAAAADEVPQPLIDQLAPGGRLVMPVGRFFQELILVEKSLDGKIRRKNLGGVAFVPMTGEARQ